MFSDAIHLVGCLEDQTLLSPPGLGNKLVPCLCRQHLDLPQKDLYRIHFFFQFSECRKHFVEIKGDFGFFNTYTVRTINNAMQGGNKLPFLCRQHLDLPQKDLYQIHFFF